MQVETYEVTETNPETGLAEFEPEALALIESLGLDGQQALLSHRTAANGEGDVVAVCPYAEMDLVAYRIYDVMLPDKMELRSYDRGPIPLRVLQVAALAEREGWFDSLSVWCSPSSAEKDPILVGVRKPTGSRYESRFFLLARWGEALAPLEELKKIARERWIEGVRSDLEQKVADGQRLLATLDALATKHFAGGHVSVWI